MERHRRHAATHDSIRACRISSRPRGVRRRHHARVMRRGRVRPRVEHGTHDDGAHSCVGTLEAPDRRAPRGRHQSRRRARFLRGLVRERRRVGDWVRER